LLQELAVIRFSAENGGAHILVLRYATRLLAARRSV
jgi:hypothetical protein